MYFLIYSEDKLDSLALRTENRAAHLAWLTSDSNVVVKIAGPWLDPDGIMRGSLLIVSTDNLDTVKNWLAQDPYGLAGLTAKTTIKPYNWVIGAP